MNDEQSGDVAPPPSGAAPTSRLALAGLCLATLPWWAWGACQAEALPKSVQLPVWAAACGLSVLGAVFGFRRSGRVARSAILVGLFSPPVTFVLGLLSGAAQGKYGPHGRPLRRGGRALTPEAAPTRAWLTPIERLPPDERAAAAWRRTASVELASVAAFNHLANELLAVGAPPELVLNALRDGRDEVHHAVACYSLAQAFDGRSEGPAAFPPAVTPRPAGPATVQTLVLECLVESGLFEATSALVAGRLAARPGLAPTVRDTLARIATDEARHAEHGWAVVEWGWWAVSHELAQRALASAEAPRGDVDLLNAGIADDVVWADCFRQAKQAAASRLASLRSAAARCAADGAPPGRAA